MGRGSGISSCGFDHMPTKCQQQSRNPPHPVRGEEAGRSRNPEWVGVHLRMVGVCMGHQGSMS